MVNHIGEIANIGWGIGSVRIFRTFGSDGSEFHARWGLEMGYQWAFVSSRFDKYARMQYIISFSEIKLSNHWGSTR